MDPAPPVHGVIPSTTTPISHYISEMRLKSLPVAFITVALLIARENFCLSVDEPIDYIAGEIWSIPAFDTPAPFSIVINNFAGYTASCYKAGHLAFALSC